MISTYEKVHAIRVASQVSTQIVLHPDDFKEAIDHIQDFKPEKDETIISEGIRGYLGFCTVCVGEKVDPETIWDGEGHLPMEALTLLPITELDLTEEDLAIIEQLEKTSFKEMGL